MSKKNLRNWALIAEIVGGMAVVVSLIFIGFQIKQSSLESNLNTRAIEVNAYQVLARQMNEIRFESMINPDFSALLESVMRNEIPAVAPIDRQVASYLGYIAQHSNMAFFQFSQGLITDEQLYGMLGGLRANLRTDVGKLHWGNTTTFTEDFKNYVKIQMRLDQPADDFWQNQ